MLAVGCSVVERRLLYRGFMKVNQPIRVAHREVIDVFVLGWLKVVNKARRIVWWKETLDRMSCEQYC